MMGEPVPAAARADSFARSPRPIRRVAVIGSGLIGSGWAALFSAAGIPVAAYDNDGTARTEFFERMERARGHLRRLGQIGDGEVRWCESLADAVANADLVQENVPESATLKQELFRKIQAAADGLAIVASSTTALLWSEITQGTPAPERIIVAHPFNPVHLMPLVELFGRDPEIVARAVAFYESIGKVPIRMKRESRGHIANRLAAALYREAVHIVAEDVADVADVDRAVVEGPGLRWSVVGAHMTYHLGGGAGGIRRYLELLGPSQEERWRSLGTPTLTETVKARLVEGVLAEANGRSISDLEKERDEGLIQALVARRAAKA